MRILRIVAFSAALAACGGDDEKAAATSVTITGANAMTAGSAASFVASASCVGIAQVAVAAVTVSNVANACQYFQSGQDKQGAAGAVIGVVRVNVIPGRTPPAIQPGSYSISRLSSLTGGGALPGADSEGNITFAFAESSKSDVACNDTVSAEAVSGTVTLTAVANGDVAGSVSAALDASDGGGAITGSFAGTSCTFNTAGLCTGNVTPDGGACVP